MLWDVIRDWFVTYVFGGTASNGNGVGGVLGYGFLVKDGVSYELDNASSERVGVVLNGFSDGYDPLFGGSGFGESPLIISVGDWLSTTATIITLIAGCVLLFFVLKWLFKLFAGMISGVGR